MIFIKLQYQNRMVGFKDETVEREVRPEEAERKAILETCQAYVDGKIEPMILCAGHANLKTRETIHLIEKKGKGRKIERTHRIVPIKIQNFVAAKIRPAHPDDISGKGRDVLRCILDDGSKFDLPWSFTPEPEEEPKLEEETVTVKEYFQDAIDVLEEAGEDELAEKTRAIRDQALEDDLSLQEAIAILEASEKPAEPTTES